MLSLIDYGLIFCLGAIGGFLSGFLGVGGGIIYIPILSYFLSLMGLSGDELVKAILANSLFTIIFSGGISSYQQYRAGNFYFKKVLETAVPGIFSVLLTTYFIRNGDWYSYKVFNYVFATMLLIIAFRMFTSKSKTADEKSTDAGHFQYGLTGFFTGIVTALSGLGGGVLMTPVFTDVFKQPIRKASSISNGVIPIFAVAVGIYNLSGTSVSLIHPWQIGFIIFPVVLPMIFAALIFAPLGVIASHKVSHQVIRMVFATFVSLVFIKTLWIILS